MMPQLKITKEDRELSSMLRDMIEGTVDEIKLQLPHIDMKPPISDMQIKEALLGMTPDGWEKLYQQYGRQPVMEFVSDFSKGRQW